MSYKLLVEKVHEVLNNLQKYCPNYQGNGYEIAGFGWHQGWNDRIDQKAVDAYENNLVHLIKDLRKDLKRPQLPFVIANTGMNGRDAKANAGTFGKLCEAQLAIGDPQKHPEFAGTVASVETRDFARPVEQSPSNFGYHWNHNGESHFLVGEAMGKAMLKLLRK
jgi:alpha-galactosidase